MSKQARPYSLREIYRDTPSEFMESPMFFEFNGRLHPISEVRFGRDSNNKKRVIMRPAVPVDDEEEDDLDL